MHFDLTVRDVTGVDRDVAVAAPPGAVLRDLVAADPALTAAVESGAQLWCGTRPAALDEPLSRAGLRSGSVMYVGRPGRVGGATAVGSTLDVVGGPDAGRTLALEAGLVSIGRAPECSLPLTDPTVSRHHAELAVTSRGISVRDLSSTSGIELDGVPIDRDGARLEAGGLLRLGRSLLTVAAPDLAAEPPASMRPDGRGGLTVHRAPRRRRSPSVALVDLPAPPRRDGPARIAWVAALLPGAAGVALAVALHSPQFLVLASLSPLIVVASALGDRLHWRRQRRRDAATHRRRSAAARDAVASALAAETVRRRDDQPDPVTVARIASVPTVRLWTRRPDDDNGLTVRVGLGDAPSQLQVRRDETREPAGRVSSVPLVVDLRAGPLGLVAPRGPGLAIGRWVLAQLAVHHSPADLRLVLLLSEPSAQAWTWARWLPHVTCVAVGAAEQRAALEQLADVSRGGGARAATSTVLLVDRFGVNEPAPALGTARAPGVSVLYLETEARRLPAGCVTVARVDGAGSVEVTAPEGSPSGEAIADQVTAGWADTVARSLAPLVDDAAAGSTAVPHSARLRDLLQPADPSTEDVVRGWSGADGGAATGLGLTADGPVVLDLVRDGPHALVAGTTGSGKSELLQSLVVGLAVAHPPDELVLVLVDYKGGAAFGHCARLPHVVGLVTDLDHQLTARALASLNAELVRRERLFAEAAAPDLATYRASSPTETVPRLILVVDEFAALAEELPEFVSGLVALAQRGRSLGVHLVLATQRPHGVVSADIRANVGVRVSLRVADPAESRDVIGTDAAAAIDRVRPGRALLRTGDTLTEFQTGHLGARGRPVGTPKLAVTRLDTWRRPRPAADDTVGSPTDLEVLVARVRKAAEVSGRRATRRPWLAPLPAAISAEELGRPARPTLVRLGRLDRPERQQQPALELDLRAGGSLLLIGAPRSGRTTALLTLAGTAAAQLPPHRLQLHVVDAAGGLLPLQRLPHTVTMLGRRDLPLVDTLLSRLDGELQRRQAHLSALGLGATADLTDEFGPPDTDSPLGDALTPLLLLIDGWHTVLASADDEASARVADRMQGLLGGASSTGLTIALAGDRSCLSPRLSAAVSSRLVLRLADRNDYPTAGIAPGLVPAALPPGRAVCAPDGVEAQLAHFGATPGTLAADEALRHLAERHRGSRPGTAAVRVRPLPDRVSLDDLGGPSSPGRVVLGVGGDAAEPITVDLGTAPARLLVAGPPRSGRTTALLSLLRQAGDADLLPAVAAPARSPLHAAARAVDVPLLDPARASPAALPDDTGLLLVDDWEAVADTAVADVLAATLTPAGDDGPNPAIVLAGRTDDLLLAYRGLAAEVRRSRRALLLHPGSGDGDLVGLRLPRARPAAVPGRGLLVGEPDWGPAFGAGPVPIQVAVP